MLMRPVYCAVLIGLSDIWDIGALVASVLLLHQFMQLTNRTSLKDILIIS